MSFTPLKGGGHRLKSTQKPIVIIVVSLRKNVVPALESVPLERIQKHFTKVHHYMFAYLQGLKGGSELENLVKQYKKQSNHIGEYLRNINSLVLHSLYVFSTMSC